MIGAHNDRTSAFRALAGAPAPWVRAEPRAARHKLVRAARRAVAQWWCAEHEASAGNEQRVAQLRRAVCVAQRRVLEHCAAVSEQHEQHVRLLLLDLMARDKAEDARQAALGAPESAGECDERAQLVVQLTAPDEYFSERARAMRRVRGQVERTGALMVRVGALVREQSDSIERLAHGVERADARIGAAHNELLDAAPRAYRTWRWRARTHCVPHSLAARLRLCLAALIAFNVALFALGVL